MMIQRIHSITEFLGAWLSLYTPTDLVRKRSTTPHHTSTYSYYWHYIISVFFRLLPSYPVFCKAVAKIQVL
uniref:Secreted protein n=1 Tax=Ascaris lumbricoides TaxID=6252 RepID=A0A0M3HUJ6_ASCLU